MNTQIIVWTAPLVLLGAIGLGTWVQPAVPPASADELTEVAIGYFKGDKNELAWKTFNEVLAREPRHFRALYGAGTLAMAEEDAAKAERYFLAALTVKPDSRDAALSLGALHQKGQFYDKALSVYERLAALDPTYAPVQYNMGMLYLAIGDAAAGIKHLETYLRLDPHSSDRERVEGRIAKAKAIQKNARP